MTPEGLTRLKDHEGLRLKPYTDTVGKLSIGYGRNLTDTGISFDEATSMLNTDVARATAQARNTFDWFDDLTPARQDVIVMLIFNMGLAGFRTFRNLIGALDNSDWTQAAWELSNSKWAQQVGDNRRRTLCDALEKGVWS